MSSAPLVLVVQHLGAPVERRVFHGERVTIGRRATNALVLPAPEVSQQHAVLERRENGWVILECGSTNGSAVDGERVEPGTPRPLPHGACLAIGPFRLSIGDAADARGPAADTRADVAAARDDAGASSWWRLSERITDLLRARFPRTALPADLEFEDFVSEVMLLVVRDLGQYQPRGPGSFLGWVHTLAQNRLLDLWRHHNARRRRASGARRDADLEAVADDSAVTGTQVLRLRELEALEMECVGGLRPEARVIYLMRRRDEAGFAAISAATGRGSEIAVRSLFKRAREQVRECIARKADALAGRLLRQL